MVARVVAWSVVRFDDVHSYLLLYKFYIIVAVLERKLDEIHDEGKKLWLDHSMSYAVSGNPKGNESQNAYIGQWARQVV